MSLLNAQALTATTDHTAAIIYITPGQPDQIISRAAFRKAVQQYATGLTQLGAQAGDLILIADTQSLAAVYTFWGALWIGAIPTLFPTQTEKLDPVIYRQRMGKLVTLSAVRLIITNQNFAPSLQADPAITCPVHTTEELVLPKTTPSTPYLAKAKDIAFLQHSSGTTGLQKGVALTHTAVSQHLQDYATTLNLTEDDIVVSWLPIYHDMGLIAGFLLPLVMGVPLVLMSPFDWARIPAMLFRAISQYKGTLCWLPNFAYNHCARRIRQRDLQGLSLKSMRLFINCSEPVQLNSHQIFQQKFERLGLAPEALGVSYAMAENTFAVTQTTPGKAVRADTIHGRDLAEKQIATPTDAQNPQLTTYLSCGQPLPRTEIRILGTHGNELTERHIGHISIKSPYMLRDYYNRPDLHPFDSHGWYGTGDMGYMADGELFVIGRKKEIIINAGKNIYPQDIEAILNQVEGVYPGRVAVFGVPDEREGTELLVALVEAKPEAQETEAKTELGRRLRQAVAQQSMVTLSYAQVVPPRWLLKTSSGKIGRAANREKWLQSGRRP